ncbi:MAG TPA: MoxR family ATPase [Steroidobacteraceae bacterium]|jgi:MoxR-like ATPase
MTSALQTLEGQLRTELGRSVIGAETSIRALLLALVARGHVLVQGVPGLGKTLLAKTLARILGGRFKRIQGTSDLMPGDIIGVHVFDEAQRRFEFRPGPLFADVVLVDEINRAGPKTQSALLEAMEERQVSVDGEVFTLPEDFLVLATQNPREFEGTYPLPESQLDRFMLRIDIDYPARESEALILSRYGGMQSDPQSGPVAGPGQGQPGRASATSSAVDRSLIVAARAQADQVHVSDALAAYVLDVARGSRVHPRLALGLSTRGTLALLRAARVGAGLRGSEFVSPDDVKAVAVEVIAHRLVLTPEAALEGMTDIEVVKGLMADTPVPR